jgi:predicted Zn-dependent peptidase
MTKFFFNNATAIALLLLACTTASGDVGIFRIPADRFQALYLVTDDRASTAEIHFVVQSGEADQDESEGLAHYVEHLAWLNVLEVERGFQTHNSNAWTSHLATGYWVAGPNADFSRLLHSLLRIFEPIRLDTELLLGERGILLSEYYTRNVPGSSAAIDEAVTRKLYASTSLARSVIGDPAVIPAYDLTDALALHQHTHRMANTVVLVYGNLSVAEIESAFTSIDDPGLIAALDTPLPDLSQLAPERIVESLTVENAARAGLYYKKLIRLPVGFSALEYADQLARLSILEGVLESSLEGGLGKPLRFDQFVARSLAVSFRTLGRNYLEFSLNATPDLDITLQQLVLSFESALGEIAIAGIPGATFDRIQSRTTGDLQNTVNSSRMTRDQALAAISSRRDPFDMDTAVAALSSTGLGDINLLLSTLAEPGRIAMYLVNSRDAKEN